MTRDRSDRVGGALILRAALLANGASHADPGSIAPLLFYMKLKRSSVAATPRFDGSIRNTGWLTKPRFDSFNGVHTIYGQGTFAFPHKHLNWPET